MRIGFVFRSRRFARKFQTDKLLLQNVVVQSEKYARVEILNRRKLVMSLNDRTINYDLICSMSRDPELLQILSVHEEKGIRVVNKTRSLFTLLNNGLLNVQLSKGGIDVPPMYTIANGELPTRYPVILKPFSKLNVSFGNIKIVRSSADFLDSNVLAIAQELLVPEILLKSYVIGQRVLSIRKIANVFGDRKTHDLDPEESKQIELISLKCGKILGLEIYNVEILRARGRHYVIDVNDFPSFEGVSAAPESIAKFLLNK